MNLILIFSKNTLILIFCLTSLLASAQENETVITNVNLFDGINTIENTNVVFKDGKIIKISGTTEVLPGAMMIDGRGKTMIPPLINAHVHVWMSDNLKDALRNGVFAMLDMHTTDEAANSLRKYNDSLEYAEYYSSNAGATVPGGHGTQFGIPVPTINDSVSASDFVKERILKNADYIKILKEPLRPTLNSTQTREVIVEAHNNKKLAVAHVSKLENALELTAQDVDGFVHIWFDKSASEQDIELMSEKKIFIVPTLSVIEKLYLLLKDKDWIKNSMPFDKVTEDVRKAYKANIPILAGTDSPNFDLNYTTDLFEEMLLLSKAGLTNEDVLKSATINIYNAFGLKNYGRLEPGIDASFILVEGNPLKNINDIKNSKHIFKKGIEIK